ncbi:MAG: hypothetical protein KGM42_05010 [Hyphomicrobiales bacterium]|nr:hypothetical protein [Hyphomicrobiales bacterium]
MYVSLEQAIEIHGRALRHRKGVKAGAAAALERAERCKANGDNEGYEVWRRVSSVIARPEEKSGHGLPN